MRTTLTTVLGRLAKGLGICRVLSGTIILLITGCATRSFNPSTTERWLPDGSLSIVRPIPRFNLVSEAMASPKEMAEPTTYTLSRLDRLLHPSMTEVWGRVSTWPLELATFLTAEPCRPQMPQIRQAGHLRERRGYRMLPECAELPPERGRATRGKSPLQYRDGPHRRANNPPPYEGEGVRRQAPLPPARQSGRRPHGNAALQPVPTRPTQQPGPLYCGGDPPP